jgi:hypothetical protein
VERVWFRRKATIPPADLPVLSKLSFAAQPEAAGRVSFAGNMNCPTNMKTRITLIVSAAAALALVPALQAEGGPKGGKGNGGKEGCRPRPGKMFEKRDADGDGVLTKEEFLGGVKDEARKPKAEERFAKLDADGDGKVTKDEMKGAMKKHRERKGKGGDKAPTAE